MTSVYIIGSLRNEEIGDLAENLRLAFPDTEFFASWLAAGPEADDYWKSYEQYRGLTFKEALADYAAQNVVDFDKRHLDRCDMAILVGPAGKSAHTELGYMIGSGKPTIYYLPEEPEADRWDVMIGLAGTVAIGVKDLEEAVNGLLKPHEGGGSPIADENGGDPWPVPFSFLIGREFVWTPYEGHAWVNMPLDTRKVHALMTKDGYRWDEINGFTHYNIQSVADHCRALLSRGTDRDAPVTREELYEQISRA